MPVKLNRDGTRQLIRADELDDEARAEYERHVAKVRKPRVMDEARQRELAAREREGLRKLGIDNE